MSTAIVLAFISRRVNVSADGRMQSTSLIRNRGCGLIDFALSAKRLYRTSVASTAFEKFGSFIADNLIQRRKCGKALLDEL